MNYWKNALVDNTLKKLLIFIIVIFCYFVFGPDGYIFDISFFKYYFYPSKNNVVAGIINKIKNIHPADINSYSNFELYRLFENLLITHERLNYELIRVQGRFMFFVVSSIGIIIFSFKWFVKILISSYFIQRYIITKRIDNIQEERNIFATKQHKIFKDLNYIFSDIENFIINKKSKHYQEINKLVIKENKYDLDMRKLERIPTTMLRVWTFLVYSVIALKVFYLTNNSLAKNEAMKYAAKLAIGAVNVGWIGMNLSNLYQSLTEISLRLGTYQSLIKKISLQKRNKFIDSFNKYISITDTHLTLFNIKLEKDLIQIAGESGKGKSTLLDAIFYNNTEMQQSSIYLKQAVDLDMKNKTPIEIVIGFNDETDINLAEKSLKLVNNKLNNELKIKKLSGGERQRLLIAASIYRLLNKKDYIKYFLIDEGDTNIDTSSYSQILKNIMNEFKLKIIFTTHKENLLNDLDNEMKTNVQIINITDKV